jgi:hypothetical protein
MGRIRVKNAVTSASERAQGARRSSAMPVTRHSKARTAKTVVMSGISQGMFANGKL